MVNGPVYVRMLRGEIPRLFDKSQPMFLGKARQISKGKDITLLSSGICTEEAMRVVLVLKKQGVSINHLHISTLKPFADEMVIEAISNNSYGIITMENHSIIGGLGTAVAEKMAEAGIPRPLVRIGLKDTYAHGASRQYLMKEYGIDARALVNEIEKLAKTKFNIFEDELKKADFSSVHTDAKPEGL